MKLLIGIVKSHYKKKNYTSSRGFRDHFVRDAQLLGGSLGQQKKDLLFATIKVMRTAKYQV